MQSCRRWPKMAKRLWGRTSCVLCFLRNLLRTLFSEKFAAYFAFRETCCVVCFLRKFGKVCVPAENSFSLKVFFLWVGRGERGSSYFWKSLRSQSCLGARSLPGRLEFQGAHGVPRSCCVKHANPTELHGGPTEFHGISTELHGVPRSCPEFHGACPAKGRCGFTRHSAITKLPVLWLKSFYFSLTYFFICYFYLFIILCIYLCICLLIILKFNLFII